MLMKKVFCCSVLFIIFNVNAQDRKNETKESKFQIGYFYSMDYSCRELFDDFNNGFSTGLEFSREIKKNRIGIGLYFSQAKFYEEIGIMLPYGGDTGPSFMDLYVKVTQKKEFIETPFIWNHVLINKSKFNFYFTIGIYPSFYIKSKNQAYFWYDGEERDVDFYYSRTGDSSFFDNKINTYHKIPIVLTTLFGLGFDYKIKDNFSICIRPEIKSKISFRYEETIKNIGLNFGVRYCLQ